MRTIATVGGIGFSPIAPGTLASLVGLGVSWILRSAGVWQQWVGACVGIGLAVWSAGPTAKAMGKKDPPAVVIDEVAGILVACAAFPTDWRIYLSCFFLFRFLDVLKPPFIRQLEKLPGSWGILADDLAAGLLANGLVRGFLLFVP